ncbi:hypothetical protein NE237_025743 [Protea cynaroides]|uniref:Uncharacterized protein n=1 Tax=Protea cynaroides TaxID=273540 RepID=A0A9Q0H6T6_9MAGN|nr:hypothetical protein NE237_025743 [Protea cynaroides]
MPASTLARLTHIRSPPRRRRPLPHKQWKSDAMLGCSLSTVGSLLTLKYADQNPFQTHPLLIEVSVVAMLVSFNASVFSMLLRPFKRLQPLANYVSVVSGALALVLLGSIVLNGKLKWLAFLLCASPWAFLFIHFFRSLFQRIHRRTVEAVLAVLHVLGAPEELNLNTLHRQLPTLLTNQFEFFE